MVATVPGIMRASRPLAAQAATPHSTPENSGLRKIPRHFSRTRTTLSSAIRLSTTITT